MSAPNLRPFLLAAIGAVLVAGAAGCTQTATPAPAAARGSPAAGGQPPPCAVATAPPLAVTPTTITTIEQPYYCVFAHYYSEPVLDDRVLLAGAFAGQDPDVGKALTLLGG